MDKINQEIKKYETLKKTHINSLKTIETKLKELKTGWRPI